MHMGVAAAAATATVAAAYAGVAAARRNHKPTEGMHGGLCVQTASCSPSRCQGSCGGCASAGEQHHQCRGRLLLREIKLGLPPE